MCLLIQKIDTDFVSNPEDQGIAMFAVTRKRKKSFIVVDGVNHPTRALRVASPRIERERVTPGAQVNVDVCAPHPRTGSQVLGASGTPIRRRNPRCLVCSGALRFSCTGEFGRMCKCAFHVFGRVQRAREGGAYGVSKLCEQPEIQKSVSSVPHWNATSGLGEC